MKESCVRFWNICALAALALLLPALSAHADAPDFREGMSHTEVRRHGVSSRIANRGALHGFNYWVMCANRREESIV